jgi:hypothetical protein
VKVAHLLTVLFALVACQRADRPAGDTTARAADAAPPAPEPQTATLDDFRKLGWLLGSWRGQTPEGKSFFERYTSVDDSTMRMTAYADSTFGSPTDSSRIVFRNGVVANEGATARWVATRVDSTGADFAPERGARNHFTWARESATRWNATLRWTDQQGRPQSVVYALQKVNR